MNIFGFLHYFIAITYSLPNLVSGPFRASSYQTGVRKAGWVESTHGRPLHSWDSIGNHFKIPTVSFCIVVA